MEPTPDTLWEKYKKYFNKQKALLPPEQRRKMDLVVEPLKEEKEVLPPDIIRAEVNFLILPFFALSTKGLKKKLESQYKRIIRRGHERLEISLNISANPKYGYPGPFDKEVHKTIEYIISNLKPPIQNPICIGSLYSIAKLMGVTPSGKISRDIKKALQRMLFTGIESKGAYYSKSKKKWIEDNFHIIDRIIFKGEELSDGEIADTNYLFLNSWYLENINARYVKPLDYTYYRSLNSPIARRIYELLGVKFYGCAFVRYRYSTLCQLLPISRQRYLSKAREKLDPAHKELKTNEFLEKHQWNPLPVKNQADWYITYWPGKKAKEEIEKYKSLERGEPLALAEPEEEPEADFLVEDILEVTHDPHSKAFYKKIVKLLPETTIRRAISETRVESQMGNVQNRPKYFTSLIKKFAQEKGINL